MDKEREEYIRDKIMGYSDLKLEYCHGSNSGKAIYLTNETGGIRVAGGKCWGFIKTQWSDTLDINAMEEMIKLFRKEIRKIKKYRKEWEIIEKKETSDE